MDKAFGSVRVLQDVAFTVSAGRVVALSGENGAGKSTLMKIITGIYRRDAGTMRYRGQDRSVALSLVIPGGSRPPGTREMATT